MARGRQCWRHCWLFSRFSSFLQGQQRFQVDQTLRTVEGIVLRSFRHACGYGLPKIWRNPDSHQPVISCATLSIIQSPPFLKPKRFDFNGKSLRILSCLKALFANWLYKILIHVIKSVMQQIFYFVCLVARPLTGG